MKALTINCNCATVPHIQNAIDYSDDYENLL